MRGAIGLVAFGLVSLTAAQRLPLQVDPIVGHWDTVREAGEPVVIADARKWKTDTATPFPLAAVRGVKDFTGGVLSVKFKLMAGERKRLLEGTEHLQLPLNAEFLILL